MECINRVDLLDVLLVCAGLCWSAEYELDHVENSQTAKRQRIMPAVGEAFGVKPFIRIQEGLGSVRANNGNQSFTKSLE